MSTKACIIRTDANPQIGGGHMMRCLALAEAWQARGGEVIFATQCDSPALVSRIAAVVPQVVHVAATVPSAADDGLLELVRTVTDRHGSPPWVVLDGYHFDETYQRTVRAAGARVLVIDDYAHLPAYHADLVLNQNLGAENLRYSVQAGAVLLLGPRYALVRTEFQRWRGWPKTVPDVARKVLITAGMSASREFLRAAVAAVQGTGIPEMEVAVVAGPNVSGGPPLAEVSGSAGLRMQVVENPADLSGWMAWADVAIAAGGVTTWELAFMGVPAVLVAVADNQRGAVRAMAESGAADYGGEAPDLAWTAVSATLRLLMRDADRRRHMSATARRLVDGCGAERVVGVLAATAA